MVDGRVAPEETVGWPVHPSGTSSGPYARPGLAEAVDGAITDGTWWPELHGLTHYDLFAYAAARRRGDATERRARDYGCFAYDGFLRETELASDDPRRARNVASMAVALFERRFGRRPHSMIAPDYRWGPEDEDAWSELGIDVVQAKREQIDARLRPSSRWGRLSKWWERTRDLHRGRFVYLDRPARLEPYGDPDPACEQGALEAAAAVRAAWQRGEPGILSVHRVQFSSFDSQVAQVGRDQLRRCLRELQRDGSVQFLVDLEVAQLLRRGWSRIERGGTTVVRNHSGGNIRLRVPEGGSLRSLGPGVHRFPARSGALPGASGGGASSFTINCSWAMG